MTVSCSWPPRKSSTNGSEAPISTRPTIILAGKPTAKMFSCGTTRETTPNAASTMISAISTGAAIMNADTKMPENAICAPWTIEPIAGASRQRHGVVGAREALRRPTRRRRAR